MIHFSVEGLPIPQGSKVVARGGGKTWLRGSILCLSNILSSRLEAASKEWWNTPRGLTLNQAELIGGLA